MPQPYKIAKNVYLFEVKRHFHPAKRFAVIHEAKKGALGKVRNLFLSFFSPKKKQL